MKINPRAIQMREVTTKVVQILAAKHIKVTQRGTRAYVRYNERTLVPELVNIPFIPDDADDDLLAAIEGFIDHELGHIFFSDPKALVEGIKKGVKSIHNALEDVYIEKRQKEHMKGAGINLENVGRFFLKNYTEKKLKSDPKNKIAYLMIPAIRAWGGQMLFREYMDENGYWKDMESITKRLGKLVEEIPHIRDSWHALDLAVRMKKVLKLGEEPPPAKEKPKKAPKDEKFDDSGGDDEKFDDSGSDEHSETKSGSSKEPEESGDEKLEGDDPSGEPGDEKFDEGDEKGEPGDEKFEGSGASEDEDSDDEKYEGGGKPEDESGDEKFTGAGEGSGSSKEGTAEDGEFGDSEFDEGEDSDEDDGDGVEDADASGAEAKEIGDEETEGLGEKADDLYEELEASMGDYDGALESTLHESMETAARSSDYYIWTRDFDVVEEFKATSTSKGDLDRRVEAMQIKADALTGVMQKDLERAIAARSMAVWRSGLRRGRLNASALSRLRFNDDRVFRKREVAISKDVAISLLVDNSGSMGGGRIETASEAAFAMSSVLDRMNIANEVLGFTARYNSSIQAEFAKAESSSKVRFARTLPLYIPIYKAFDERLNPETKRRIAAMSITRGLLQENVDGESVQIAAKRLAARKEKRHIMIVFSDGQPACPGDYAALQRHLKDSVAMVAKSGIDIIGIGIQTTAVNSYYPKKVVLNKVEDLAGEVMTQLRNILLTD